MAESEILDPAVARRVFTAAIASFRDGIHSIPGTPPSEWKVADASFPFLKVQVIVRGLPHLLVVVDCTNFDFDPPAIHFEDLSGHPIGWRQIQQWVAPYSGMVRGEFKDNINDVILFPSGTGVVCRVGQAGYHEVHPEVNWRDVRTANEGRLEFIIDSSIRLLDANKI